MRTSIKSKRRPLIKFFAITAIAVVIAMGLAWWRFQAGQQTPVYAPIDQEHVSETTEDTPPEKRARFVAVGDMLIHDDIYNDFEVADGYDFTPAFKHITTVIDSADFAMLNQETPLGGTDLGLSGLYVANSPQALGHAEAAAGFNIIQLANNHIWDRGEEGLTRSVEFWDQYEDIITTGAYTSQTAREATPVIKKNGIELAVLGYSYGSNLGPVANSFNINTIDEKLIVRDVARAKKEADFVVVGMHWGVEKVRRPSRQQRELAQTLADMGVDVIVGTHPHVLQAPQWLEGKGGNKTYVMYSLGNFLSIHTEKVPHTLTGVISGLEFVIEPNGDKRIENPFAVLTWNYFDRSERNFAVMPFEHVSQNDFWMASGLNFQQHNKDYRQFYSSKADVAFPDLEFFEN